MSSTLFRKASLDSISSPEQLDDYIKVSNPGIWMVLASLFILLAAVLVWSIKGGLPTSIHVPGMADGGTVWCYVNANKAAAIKTGQTVRIQAGGDTINGEVAGVGTVPLSAAEIAADLKSDYWAQALAPQGYAVKVAVSPDRKDIPDKTLLNLSIVTDTVRPVDFLLK